MLLFGWPSGEPDGGNPMGETRWGIVHTHGFEISEPHQHRDLPHEYQFQSMS